MKRVTVLRIAAREEHIAGNYLTETVMPAFDMQPLLGAEPGACLWHHHRAVTHHTPVHCLQYPDGKREYFACDHELWKTLQTIYEPEVEEIKARLKHAHDRLGKFSNATLWQRLKLAWRGYL